MTTEQKLDKGMSDIVGALTDPIIVMPGGWGDSLPDWIKPAITMERLIENMKAIRGEEPTGTDAEAVAYLYTASLTAPMGHNWAQIYLYLAGKEMERHKKVEVPEDIQVKSLNAGQERDLKGLKDWIYSTRVKSRKGKERDERREKRKEVAAKKIVEHPAMFDLQSYT